MRERGIVYKEKPTTVAVLFIDSSPDVWKRGVEFLGIVLHGIINLVKV